LTFLLSHGQENFTLHAELNWNVLGVTAALSVVCGLLFGLAPAIQSTRPDVMPTLKDGRGGGPRRPRAARSGGRPNRDLFFSSCRRRVCLSGHSTSCTPSNWDTARENILLFSLNARPGRASRPGDRPFFYADLRKRFESSLAWSSATLSQSSIIKRRLRRAGQSGGQ